MHAPTPIFGRNLTPFSLKLEATSYDTAGSVVATSTVATIGLGCIVALHHPSSTLYQIH
jgi:hypothetical protein